jgi:hypothetical protein
MRKQIDGVFEVISEGCGDIAVRDTENHGLKATPIL